MRKNPGPFYSSPVAIWISSFFLIPLGIIFTYSFMRKGLYGGVVPGFCLDAYSALSNITFLKITASTLYIALFSTLAIIVLAIPSAYFMARSRHKSFFLFLVIIPFWTNFLIRIYAWIAILGNNGFLNSMLISSGLFSHHVQFLYNKYAVILVTAYTYLPFAILPLYSTIEKFDFSLLEAAQDLGATKWQALRKVLFPNIRGGITTAILFTFIPAFGSYAIPQILGGSDSLMIGNVIARELTVTRNWPLASSISVVLTILTTLGVVFFMKLNQNASGSVRRIATAEKGVNA
ncbi:MAG: ABC transporter permease [Fibrobacter sp.]|jgi:spermidine/putrescine transport system permease protein|nr:ABC transporter permease [Fibrobacter sp.]